MKPGGGIGIRFVEHVVNAGGELEALDEFAAEEREVHNAETGSGLALNRHRLTTSRGAVKRAPLAGRLKFHARKDFFPPNREAEVEPR